MELQFDEAEAVLPEELPQEDNTVTVTYTLHIACRFTTRGH